MKRRKRTSTHDQPKTHDEKQRQSNKEGKEEQDLMRQQEQQLTFLWSELKAELFELALSMLGETGITLYEMRAALESALHVLQMKERQYRRIPREIIERIVDQIFPNDGRNRRSLVRFCIAELQRMRDQSYRYGRSEELNEEVNEEERGEEDTELLKRAATVMAYTISELAERRLVPLPSITFKDDQSAADEGLFSIDTNSAIPPGRLQIHLPVYRNPKQHLKQLQEQFEQRMKDLQSRLEDVDQLYTQFNNCSERDKALISMQLGRAYLRTLKKNRRKKAAEKEKERQERQFVTVETVVAEYNKQLEAALRSYTSKKNRIQSLQKPKTIDESATIPVPATSVISDRLKGLVEDPEKTKTLREGAYTYLEMAFKDKYGMDLELEMPDLDVAKQTTKQSARVAAEIERQKELEYGQSMRMLKNNFILQKDARNVSSNDAYQLLLAQLEHESDMQSEELLHYGGGVPDRTRQWIRQKRQDLFDIAMTK